MLVVSAFASARRTGEQRELFQKIALEHEVLISALLHQETRLKGCSNSTQPLHGLQGDLEQNTGAYRDFYYKGFAAIKPHDSEPHTLCLPRAPSCVQEHKAIRRWLLPVALLQHCSRCRTLSCKRCQASCSRLERLSESNLKISF